MTKDLRKGDSESTKNERRRTQSKIGFSGEQNQRSTKGKIAKIKSVVPTLGGGEMEERKKSQNIQSRAQFAKQTK